MSHTERVDIIKHIESRTGKPCTLQDLAEVLGVSYSTIKRYGRDGLSAEQVVQCVRAYGLNAVDALVETGLLSADDVLRAEVDQAIRRYSDVELAEEILRRAEDAQSVLHEPIDEVMSRPHLRAAVPIGPDGFPDYSQMSEEDVKNYGLAAKGADEHIGPDEIPSEP